jgi:hypothetical protein
MAVEDVAPSALLKARAEALETAEALTPAGVSE